VFADSTTPTAAPPTFDEVFTEWRTRYPTTHAVAESTFANYCSFVEHHLRPYFGSMPITSISVETIEDFIAAKRAPGGSTRRDGKPLADSSLRTGLLPLRLILRRAVRRTLIPANPMNDAEWRGTTRTENVDPFSGRELRAILVAADRLEPDFATLLRLWIQTGMRAGEATGLQWQDVDLDAGTVKVRRTFSHGKIGPPKTRQERDVTITHPIANDAAEWHPGATDSARMVVHGLRRLTVRSLEPEAFVFHRGGLPLSSMEVHRTWKRVLLAAQVRYRVPEQLRHTFASTMLSRNAPLLYVQQQGGWRSASVLLRTYARWMPQLSATQAQPGSATVPAVAPRNAG